MGSMLIFNNLGTTFYESYIKSCLLDYINAVMKLSCTCMKFNLLNMRLGQQMGS